MSANGFPAIRIRLIRALDQNQVLRSQRKYLPRLWLFTVTRRLSRFLNNTTFSVYLWNGSHIITVMSYYDTPWNASKTPWNAPPLWGALKHIEVALKLLWSSQRISLKTPLKHTWGPWSLLWLSWYAMKPLWNTLIRLWNLPKTPSRAPEIPHDFI